jgi:hypothetical protein
MERIFFNQVGMVTPGAGYDRFHLAPTGGDEGRRDAQRLHETDGVYKPFGAS